jgi:hypothetical protein
MSELAESRNVIQWQTVIGAILSMAFLLFAIYRNLVAWRYAFLPLAILLQIVLFYFYIFIIPFPRPVDTNILSAVIRWESVWGFFIFIAMYVWVKIRE